MTDWDRTADIVAVGSGAAGLGAALAAHSRGLRPLVLEAAAQVGGSTMRAGGGMWMPANHFMLEDGDKDSPEQALEYLEALIGDDPPVSSRVRKEAFLRSAPAVLEFLEGLGMRFRRTTGYPDYYPDLPGGSKVGRGVESVIFDTRELGSWAERMPPRSFPRNLPLGTLDVSRILLAKRTPKGFARLTKVYAHHFLSKARGQSLVGGGGALLGQLLSQTLRRNIPVEMETRVVELLEDDGAVVGVVAEDAAGRRLRIRAEKAVFLGAGGFASNDALRQQHQRHPISASWTSAPPTDQGDGLTLGQSVGAATALLDEAWWGPSSFVPPDGPAIFLVSERSKPGSLIVDQSASRYFNESIDYVLAGRTMFDRNEEVPAIPSFLLFDQRYRNRYPFGPLLPGRTPADLLESGYFRRAESIEQLARACDLPPEALRQTVERFNGFARAGVDEEFHRGENDYDRYYCDPRVRPNPCLAPLEKPPFYAVELVPGDLGTKGGLVTDEHARVLRDDGSPIAGLYASGNTAASVMGRFYPGPGVTLAPTLTFSWLAMYHVSGLAAAGSPATA